MREIKHKSAVPVYLAAAVFAGYSLIAPLYSWWHFLLAALLTAGVWLVADRLIKPTIEYVPEPEKEPVSHGEAADSILVHAAEAAKQMQDLSEAIQEEDIKESIHSLVSLSDRIAEDAIQDPSDIPQIQKFQSYFLPSTIHLLQTYVRLRAPGVEGENISGAKRRIADMLHTERDAFQKQLDALYKNDALDVDADIQVMENLLAREGLGKEDELQQFLHRSQQNTQKNKEE